MAEATLIEFRNTHPALVSVSDDTLNQHLSDAKKFIEALGISSGHDRFSELQRYKAAHLLSVANVSNTNITSKSIADVSISYGGIGSYNRFNSTGWEIEFNKILTQVQGMTDRCL